MGARLVFSITMLIITVICMLACLASAVSGHDVVTQKWWEARRVKGRRVKTPGPPGPAETTTNHGGHCKCECDPPKVIRVEVPKVQIKYVPVVAKKGAEEGHHGGGEEEAEGGKGEAEEHKAPRHGAHSHGHGTEESRGGGGGGGEDGEASPDSYPASSRRQKKRSRYGISYVG